MSIDVILALIGYVKVPKEIVKLSILNEVGIEKILKDNHRLSKQQQTLLKQLKENTKAITGFLRSGRLLVK